MQTTVDRDNIIYIAETLQKLDLIMNAKALSQLAK